MKPVAACLLFIAAMCNTVVVSAQSEVNGRVTSARMAELPNEDYPEDPTFNYYFDFYVNGCNGHSMLGEITFTDEAGKVIMFKNGDKAVATFDFEPDKDTFTSDEWSSTGWNTFNTTLSPGKHTINATIRILDKTANKYIDNFVCEPASLSVTVPNFKTPYVKVIDYEMKHNLVENGRKYMNIYYDLYVRGLKDHDIVVEWVYTKANGTQLYFNNGKVAKSTKELTPTYDSAYWFGKDKYKLSQGTFYDAIKLPRGKHSLKAKMRVYDKTTKRYLNFKAPVIDFTLTRG